MYKKFAILITGYLRSFEKNLPYLQKTFEDSDIFVFTIENDEHHKTLNKLDIKNYELVKDSNLDTEEFKVYDELFLQANAIQVDSNLPRDNSTWLKQLRDYKLAINWFNTNYNEQYEYIVRFRPDLRLVKSNNIEFINNKFNCFQQNTYINQVNDKFFLGNRDIMTFFMDNIFESLKDKNISRYADKPFNVEEYIFSFLKINNMPINYLDKKLLKFKKDTNGKLLSAGFNQYKYKTLKNRVFD